MNDFETLWENYPATDDPRYYGIAEPDESTKKLARFFWRSATERAAKIAEDWKTSIYPIGEDVDYETAVAIPNDTAKNIAEAIREESGL